MLFGTLHQTHADMVIINKIVVQALTALYPTPRYIRPPYIGSTVYVQFKRNLYKIPLELLIVLEILIELV
jgi:hypothetical protein